MHASKNLGSFEFKNVAEMVYQNSKKWAHHKAYSSVLPNGIKGTITYQKTDQLSDQFAIYLRESLKIQPGDKVAIQMPNGLAYPIVVFGILKAGGVVVNTNPLYTPSEMTHQFKDSEAKLLIMADMFCNKLDEVIPQTGIKNVILSSVVDFFPNPQKTLLNLMLKHVKKQIPHCKTPFDRLEKCIKAGSKIQKEKSIQAKSYWDKISLDDLCALQYTGGTTGVSKGAMLTHRNIIANMHQIMEMGKSKIDMGVETILTVLPLYHIFAFTLNLITFYNCGGHNILIPNPRPLSNLKKPFEMFHISWLSGVNTLFNGLLNESWFRKNPPKHLKTSIAGGTALHDAVAKKWNEITNTPVIAGFGLTETSPVVSFNPLDGVVKHDTVGIPVPNTQVVLLDEEGNPVGIGDSGEIAIKGPQVMKGYWKNPTETAKAFKDGWLLTGDIGTLDADGYLKIVDRKKDMIIVSGFNVYPNEIEDCISKHPMVQEVAVIGVPSSQTGEAVKACIVKKDPSLTQEQITEHCKKYLTSYKVPKLVEFRDHLPKTPIGKILRRDLKHDTVRSQS